MYRKWLATLAHENSYSCSFYPGAIYNTIKGTLRIDDNGNNCNDNSRPISGIPVEFTDTTGQSVIIYSDSSGNYKTYTYKGLFSFAPLFQNSFFTPSPANSSVAFDTANNLIDTTNFCLQPNGLHNDLGVSLLPVNNARAGFNVNYFLTYKNRSTTVLSGAVAVNFDNNKMNFVSASENVSTQSSGQLLWNLQQPAAI